MSDKEKKKNIQCRHSYPTHCKEQMRAISAKKKQTDQAQKPNSMLRLVEVIDAKNQFDCTTTSQIRYRGFTTSQTKKIKN
jgi:hypothetical protein